MTGKIISFSSSERLTVSDPCHRIGLNNTRPASQRCAPGGLLILWAEK